MFVCRDRVVDLSSAADGAAAIQALSASNDGRFLLAGGDDKVARCYDTATWSLVATGTAPKKVRHRNVLPLDCSFARRHFLDRCPSDLGSREAQ